MKVQDSMVGRVEKQLLEKIASQIEQLRLLNPDDLSHREGLTDEINFDSAIPIIKENLEQFQPLYNRDLSKLPSKELDRIEESFRLVIDSADQIANFRIGDGVNPKQRCNEIIVDIEKKRGQILSGILLPLAVTGIWEIDVDSIQKKTNKVIDQIENKNQELDSLLEVSQKETSAALNAIRESSAYAGVTANAEAFHKQSNKHFWSSFRWLIATCLSVLLTAGVAIYFLNSITGDTTIPAAQKTNMPQSIPEAIQYIFAKLVIFSTLTFTIVLCSKNYKSHKHNQTLYDHRATTLDTFQAFYNGSNDEHVKDAILLQAAYAAFGNRQTGFESIQEKDSPPPMQIVDVLNKTVKTAESVGKDISHSS